MIGVLVRMTQGGNRAAVPVAVGAGAVGSLTHVEAAHHASAAPAVPLDALVAAPRLREPALAVAAPFALLALTGTLGVFVPGFLDQALRQAAVLLGI
jgi:hypothetical protein